MRAVRHEATPTLGSGRFHDRMETETGPKTYVHLVAIQEGVAASGSALFLQPIHEKMIVMAKTSGGFELSNQWTRRLIPLSLTDKASKLRN